MTNPLKRLAHWIVEHPPHHHLYAYHALRDEHGAVRFFWRCTFVLCDDEIIDEEGYIE